MRVGGRPVPWWTCEEGWLGAGKTQEGPRVARRTGLAPLPHNSEEKDPQICAPMSSLHSGALAWGVSGWEGAEQCVYLNGARQTTHSPLNYTLWVLPHPLVQFWPRPDPWNLGAAPLGLLCLEVSSLGRTTCNHQTCAEGQCPGQELWGPADQTCPA